MAIVSCICCDSHTLCFEVLTEQKEFFLKKAKKNANPYRIIIPLTNKFGMDKKIGELHGFSYYRDLRKTKKGWNIQV